MPHPVNKVVDKAYLIESEVEILSAGAMSREQIAQFLETGNCQGGIVQSSSGSQGKPLRIPRSRADVADVARRVLAPYVERFGTPSRIAMLGGISHAEAATRLDLGSIAMHSFGLDERDAIARLSPEIVSCYPSVIRELLHDFVEQLPDLKAIKLGGETIFATDLERIFAAFPDVLVIEQLGSTEMPAIGLRAIRRGEKSPSYTLQTERFDFYIDLERDGWQPLVVQDNFPDQFFPIGRPYDMGDEVLVENGEAVRVRRRGDPAYELIPDIEALFRAGSINVQIDMAARTIRYTPGRAGTLPATFPIQGKAFQTIAGSPERIVPSNKMKLVLNA